MISRKMAIFSLIILTVIGCSLKNNQNLNQPKYSSLNKAKQTMKNYISDIKKGKTDFNYFLNKYYYHPKEIKNAPVYFLFFAGYFHNFEKCVQNSTKSLAFFWNNQIDSVPFFDGINDNNKYSNYLLVVFDTTYHTPTHFGQEHFPFSFTKAGKIYSTLTILDPTNMSTKWVRNEKKYVHKDKKTGDTYIEIDK